ncbi:MAG: hypothetical protein JSU65_03675 [Candidatus Zixiibacteriota bacterium]|nr:MAG: hypothetical protein JSU65_03675 [candidate division Zixibacteria bacterium]
MTDPQEKKAKNSRGPRTINIEIPAGVFEAMYRIMSGRGDSASEASACCDMPRSVCCPQPTEDDGRDFVFTLRWKE